jgi:Na+/proline symporter
MAPDRVARINSTVEFSASTVAMTISMATVVLAFFELAPVLGTWLLWTVITTSLGLLVVRLAARVIWDRITIYGDHRPTLHEFLGTEYNAPAVALVGASCTAMGFLGAYAVELTVGSRFLVGLIPGVPSWLAILALALTGLIYTSAGGFRAVIVTDRIQMVTIWILIISLSGFYIWYLSSSGNSSGVLARIPRSVYDFSWREGLLSFLIGVFVINVPTFLSDMSVWQRIAGSQQRQTVFGGLGRSVISAGTSWGMLVVLACLVPIAATPSEGQNPLLALLSSIGASDRSIGPVVLFLVVLGLYGAMFSTASTQLIAVVHTVYEDIVARLRKRPLSQRLNSSHELRFSRVLLVGAAIAAMLGVEALSAAGFSIADLVFAIYGAQLGLFPPVALALFQSRTRLQTLSRWAIAAIAGGFVVGWGAAGLGKAIGNSDIVFLAPAISLLLSSLILGLGRLLTR